jgi:phage terminase Nu1 subunit (DNA packaging protein)
VDYPPAAPPAASQVIGSLTPEPDTQMTEEATAVVESVSPYWQDSSAKTAYMGYRGAGFNKREALDLVSRSDRTLYSWYANDKEFQELDNQGLNEFREKVGRDFAYADYMRNWRLTMQYDGTVLQKAVSEPENLSVEDHRYLRTIRAQYTPAALTAITAYMKGTESELHGNRTLIMQAINAVAKDSPSFGPMFDPHQAIEVTNADQERPQSNHTSEVSSQGERSQGHSNQETSGKQARP